MLYTFLLTFFFFNSTLELSLQIARTRGTNLFHKHIVWPAQSDEILFI